MSLFHFTKEVSQLNTSTCMLLFIFLIAGFYRNIAFLCIYSNLDPIIKTHRTQQIFVGNNK